MRRDFSDGMRRGPNAKTAPSIPMRLASAPSYSHCVLSRPYVAVMEVENNGERRNRETMELCAKSQRQFLRKNAFSLSAGERYSALADRSASLAYTCTAVVTTVVAWRQHRDLEEEMRKAPGSGRTAPAAPPSPPAVHDAPPPPEHLARHRCRDRRDPARVRNS